ncbi:metalloendopeptidase OMA1, mitochondrial-like [Glandiceps talaboti]
MISLRFCRNLPRLLSRQPFVKRTLQSESRTPSIRTFSSKKVSCYHGNQSRTFLQYFPKNTKGLINAPGQSSPHCNQIVKRTFQTSSRRNVHPFLIWMLAKPLAKGTAILSGRAFRKWWQSLPNEKRQVFVLLLQKNKYKLVMTASVLGAGVGIYYLSHLESTPITNRTRFIAFTKKQFSAIAAEEYKQFLERYKDSFVPAKHPVYDLVTKVTQQLLEANSDIPELQDKNWSVHIIDEPEKNAFVLPNGEIFVFTGILKTILNEDQLGIVLGHEIAHVLLGHAAEQISFAEIVDGFSIILLAAMWAFLPNDGIALVAQWFKNRVIEILLQMPYNRNLETEADEVGLQLAAKGCFDVRESSAFWECMALESEAEGNANNIELLSTHPSHQTRAEHLNQLIPKAIQLRDCYKCPHLPMKDPREMVKKLRAHIEAMRSENVVVLPSGDKIKV